MTKPINRVSVNFSRWCEKKMLFLSSEYLYKYFNDYEIHGSPKDGEAYYFFIDPLHTECIGPAPTIKEMEKYLSDQGCEIRSKKGYSLWRRFTIPFLPSPEICTVSGNAVYGDNYIFYAWLDSKTELTALQEAVRIAERINKV